LISDKQIITKNLISKPVLITGVGGFIGGHLAERLLIYGIPVKGMSRDPDSLSWLSDQGAEVFKGDLLDKTTFEKRISDCSIVVHAAGWGGANNVPPMIGWKTNVIGTKNVVEVSGNSEIERIIYLSSIGVYGMNKSPIIDETMATPVVGQLYPDSKIESERVIMSSGIPFVIIRPGCVYGPRGEGWTLTVIEQIKKGIRLQGNDAGLIPQVYIDNIIDGIFLAMIKQEAKCNVFNICDDKPVTYREFYSAYALMMGIDNLGSVPEWRIRFGRTRIASFLRLLLGRPATDPWTYHFRFNHSQISNDKAKQILGFVPEIDFAEGIHRTELWLKKNGFLN
jgi:2-alkyl-3-oxoalkanoate reductase